MWHRVHDLERTESGRITAGIEFPVDSQWVEGHFPGDPVIPAMAQIALVREALSGTGTGAFVLTGLKRVKFKAMVRPGDNIQLEINPRTDDPGTYGFRLFRERELVCSGMLQGEFQG